MSPRQHPLTFPPLRFLRRLPPPRVAALSLLLALSIIALLAVDAAPAQAQTATKLVSNTDQSPSTFVRLSADVASSFTTGAESYKLTRVDIRLNALGGTPNYSVSIWSSSSNAPGANLGTLANPASLAVGLNTFTASGDGISLGANTKYWVVIDSIQSNSSTSWSITDSTAEDSGAAAGWSIEQARTRNWNATSWISPTNSTLMFAVHGHEVITPPVLQSATAERYEVTLRYDRPLAPANPPHRAFTVKGAGQDQRPSWVEVYGIDQMVVLTLDRAPRVGETVTVSYVKPSTNFIASRNGGVAANLTNQAVVNNARPLGLVGGSVNGTRVELVFEGERLDANSVPDKSEFTVKGIGTDQIPSGVQVGGWGVWLTLARGAQVGDAVTVSYSSGGTPLQGRESGNAVPGFNNYALTNNSPRTPTRPGW